MATFELPPPPSVNTIFPTKGGTNGKGGRKKSGKYKEWLDEAGWIIKASKCTMATMPVAVDISLGWKRPGRPPDVDNYIKPIMDCLVSQGVLEDDNRKFVPEICVRWNQLLETRMSGRGCALVSIKGYQGSKLPVAWQVDKVDLR